MRIYLQRLGKAMMGPLSIIIASGFLLGLVSILQNPRIVGESISGAAGIHQVIGMMQSVVGMMFGMLPILFAVSVTIGMIKEDKEMAAFASVIGFLLFHTVISFLLAQGNITAETTSVEYLMGQGMTDVEAFQTSSAYEMVLGIFTYRMNIFGGIIVGLWTAFIHDKFHKIQLPVAFSFFSGNRFVPIMMILTIPFLSIASYFVWPFVSSIINGVGNLISVSGAFGTFIYGFAGRILTPTGLHHILNQLIRFTPIGGTAVVDGELVSGALSIFNAELAAGVPDLDVLRESTRFLSQGYHPVMLFGLPAVCLAMYNTALPEQKPKIKGMLVAAALTSFATGITEPIEFAFIFISPLLWLFHSVMSGLAFMVMTLLKVAMGNAAGGFMDFAIFGILQGTYTKWPIAILVGIVFAVVYYYVFKFAILKFDIKTPGREPAEEIAGVKGKERIQEKKMQNADELGDKLLSALGGIENIVDIDNCISRLRLVMEDTSLIDQDAVKETGSLGIFVIDKENAQVVYGTNVEHVTQTLKGAVRRKKEEEETKKCK